MTVITCRELGRRFGHTWALRHVDLDVPSGGVLGLVGPNGAGKSTFLHLVVGVTHPSEGTISVLGGRPGNDEVLPDVAFVAQSAPLPSRMKVGELVGMVARLNRRWDAAAVDARCAELALARSQRVGTLSGGQRVQLALALALAKQPRLLVLDEPVASLDPLARRSFLGALMAAVAERELSVVFSTHLLDDLARTCDHLAVIRDGSVPLAGSIDELVGSHAVLVGPADRPNPPGARSIGGGERQHQRLVQTDRPVIDPAWEVRPANLEEIVFAHLEREAPVPERHLAVV